MARHKLFGMVTFGVASYLCTGLGITGCGTGGGSSQGSVQPPAKSSTVGATNGSEGLVCTKSVYTPNFAGENDPLSGLPNRLYHWNHFPLKVYFVPSDLNTPTRQAQAVQGFTWWVQTIHVGSFQVVTDPSVADITVQYENRGLTAYGAVTNYNTDSNGVLQNATITFNMTYLAAISNIEPVAAHEFGHALGIGGHSNDAGDVMDANVSVYSDTHLATRDLNTLMTSYCGGASAAEQKSLSAPGVATAGQITCTLGTQ